MKPNLVTHCPNEGPALIQFLIEDNKTSVSMIRIGQVNEVFFVAADGNQLATAFCDRKASALQGNIVLNEAFP